MSEKNASVSLQQVVSFVVSASGKALSEIVFSIKLGVGCAMLYDHGRRNAEIGSPWGETR
jgi:hypothetical protein